MLAVVESTWDVTSADVTNAAVVVLPSVALLACVVLHYVAGSAALRAAGGVQLPWRECTLSQLAVSSANRVLPAGLGGGALNVRYLMRRGGMAASRAVTAVTALHLLGALADVVAFAGIVAVATWSGATTASPWAIAHHIASSMSALIARHAVAASVIVLLVVALAAALSRRRSLRADGDRPPVCSARMIGAELHALARRPRDLATLMLSSAATTVTLGIGLAATVIAVAGVGSTPSVLTLLVAYMVGAAVGNAVPVPSGIGTTDAALVATVVATGVSLHHALVSVVIFRIVTFWAPAAVGLPVAAALRRRGAL